jgi:PhnB protein
VSETARPQIEPWLSVADAEEAIAFYAAAFGAAPVETIAGPDGRTAVAHLSIAGATFWLAEDIDGSPETLGPAAPIRMILIVDDPDAAFARALAAGAGEMAPVEDRDYGWRIGRLVDPLGHQWEIGRPLR